MKTFYEKELQKTNKKKFRKEKVVIRKENKLNVKLKDHVILLIVGLIKKTL